MSIPGVAPACKPISPPQSPRRAAAAASGALSGGGISGPQSAAGLKPKAPSLCPTCPPPAQHRMAGPTPALRKPGSLWTNLAVAGGLLAFCAGTYWKVIHNVSSDDLERELEREIAEEERRQRKAAAKQ